MSQCKTNCGNLEVKDSQVVCLDCGHNFGYLVDIVDHAVLRCETQVKLKQAEPYKKAWEDLLAYTRASGPFPYKALENLERRLQEQTK